MGDYELEIEHIDGISYQTIEADSAEDATDLFIKNYSEDYYQITRIEATTIKGA